MRIVAATRNLNKVREIRSILSDLNIEVVSLDDIQLQITIKETGSTFSENAQLKANQVAGYVEGWCVIADDSGIEVDALGGAPGVFSARYSGIDASDLKNTQKLLDEMRNVPWEKRGARFRCVIALLDQAREMHISEGICEGIIAFEPKGHNGFGYDPIFYVPEYGLTMAQLPLNIKNRISHRAHALKELREKIEKRLIT